MLVQFEILHPKRSAEIAHKSPVGTILAIGLYIFSLLSNYQLKCSMAESRWSKFVAYFSGRMILEFHDSHFRFIRVGWL